ncbi:MAG: hypothetical protein ACRDWH_09920 [Acidimicrobiia bacterium]
MVFWLVVPFVGVALGNLYRLLNPWDSLARWARLGSGEVTPLSASEGVWPALVLFFGFSWLELIYPNSADPRTIATATLGFGLLLMAAADRFGRSRGLRAPDPFGTYNRLISLLAPLDLDPEEGPRWRGWLRALPHLPETPGTTAFALSLIGTVSFDGLSTTGWYERTLGSFGASIFGGTILLLLTVGLLGVTYWLACQTVEGLAGEGWSGAVVARSVRSRSGSYRLRLRLRPLFHFGDLRRANSSSAQSAIRLDLAGTCLVPPAGRSISPSSRRMPSGGSK